MTHVRFWLVDKEPPPPPWEPEFEVVCTLPLLSCRRRPLDPPPSCFSTTSPLRIRSHDFPSFRIPALTDSLADGFRPLYPCRILDPHGITRTDWVRFLADLPIAARDCRARPPITPLLAHHVFPVYDGCFARNPLQEVRALVQIWNQCAFERRKLRVSLHVQASGRRASYALVVESL